MWGCKKGGGGWRGGDSWVDKDWLWNTGGHVSPQTEFNWLEKKGDLAHFCSKYTPTWQMYIQKE